MVGKSKSGALPFSHELRVRYAECDAQGIVFNPHYLAYFDYALTEIWRGAFGSYAAMVARGVDTVVAEANLRFRGSARFDDLVRVEAGIERLGTTAMTTRFLLLRGEELLVEAEIRHVFVAAESMEKTPIPAWVREGLAPLLLG
jgi:acyl-CoA thioester hydrolase